MTLTIVYDLSGLKDLEKRLAKVQSRHLQYGWLKRVMHPVKGRKTGVPTAQIAFWNEFGTRNIPSRPYLTITGIIAQSTTIPLIATYFQKNIYEKVFNEKPLWDIESMLTTNFKEVVGTGRPLKESTVRKKGHSQHWVEAGKLMEDFEVKTLKKALR